MNHRNVSSPFLGYFEQNFLTLYKFMNRGYQIFFNNIFTRNADVYSDDGIHYIPQCAEGDSPVKPQIYEAPNRKT